MPRLVVQLEWVGDERRPSVDDFGTPSWPSREKTESLLVVSRNRIERGKRSADSA